MSRRIFVNKGVKHDFHCIVKPVVKRVARAVDPPCARSSVGRRPLLEPIGVARGYLHRVPKKTGTPNSY